jgi:sugar lactone lactonase YvrE
LNSSLASRAFIVGATAIALLAAGITAFGEASATSSGTVAQAATAAGTIFVSNNSGNVTAYPLTATGDVKPTTTISKGVAGPNGVIFNSSGDMWVANGNTDTIFEYTPAELAKASPAPSVIISSDRAHSLNDVTHLAIDPEGDLWADNMGSSTVVEYTKAQIAHSGSPTPHVTITADAKDSLSAPAGDTFDTSGDLWVAQNEGSAVVEYTPRQLAKSGSTIPAVTISTPNVAAAGVAFDPRGDLWVANSGGFEVLEYTKSKLAVSGKPAPTVTISASPASNTLSGPVGLLFDASGDLWATAQDSSEVLEFSPSELAKSGSPKAIRSIVGPKTGLASPVALAIQR